jgi:peroxiredoxin
LWQVLCQQGRLLLSLERIEVALAGEVAPPAPAYDPLTMGAGLPVGQPAPVFELRALEGRPITLDLLLQGGKPILLFFVNPHCGPCEALLPEIAEWQRSYENFAIMLISEGSETDNQKTIAPYGLRPVLLQRENKMTELYRAWGTPSALLIRSDGRIGSKVAQGADQIRGLIAWALRTHAPAAQDVRHLPMIDEGNASGTTIRTGELPPTLQLPDIFGRLVRVTSLGARRTVLLFWNPDCGFCQQMLGELQVWEANRSLDAPELLVVSTGTTEENKSMKLRAPILLDQSFATARLFGVGGTPMAVMLDESGTVASEVVRGAKEILALVSSTPGNHSGN